MAAGDHIIVRARFFTHHGIDMGDGTVIHFNGGAGRTDSLADAIRQKGDARIIRSTFDEFVCGRDFWYAAQHESFEAEIVCRRAESRLGEANYHVATNNCEHFANWCKTGRAISLQVDAWRRSLSTGAVRGAMAWQVLRAVGGQGTTGLFRTVSRGVGPLFVAADAAQLATTVTAQQCGWRDAPARQLGQGVGLTSSLAAGAVAAGPIGAGAAALLWAAGEFAAVAAPAAQRWLTATRDCLRAYREKQAASALEKGTVELLPE
ncbi:MAG: lecithin retinol acyltransferase family protein [Pirellulales bacterium]|nr:lecithin retinol acyltransferase family protein [Pirellulales bacterium]